MAIEWKNEREIQNHLLDLSNNAIQLIIGKEVKKVKSEFKAPSGTLSGVQARIDILVEDIDGGIHIIEVKKPEKKNRLCNYNVHGIAQLLSYDLYFRRNMKMIPTSLILATSEFDMTTKEMIPSYNLPIKMVEVHKEHINLITGYTNKYGSTN